MLRAPNETPTPRTPICIYGSSFREGRIRTKVSLRCDGIGKVGGNWDGWVEGAGAGVDGRGYKFIDNIHTYIYIYIYMATGGPFPLN